VSDCLPHKTKPIKVWVDADIGIADLVEYLNMIPGVRTIYSCQGTIGEGGLNPYRPMVGVTWSDDEAWQHLRKEFDITVQGSHWGDIHPPRPGRSPRVRYR